MMASSSTKRKTLGFSFPACGCFVMLPTSTKPNPIESSPETPTNLKTLVKN
jgi:hypothetical protein